MKEISSYRELVKRRKSVQLEREFLEREILQLHENPSSESSGMWRWIYNLHPRDISKIWEVGTYLIRKFRTSEEKKSKS